MNRRHFFRSFAGAAAGAAIAPVSALALGADNAYRKAIGIQLYTLRNQIKEDVAGTIKAVAKAGYKQVEPYGYAGGEANAMIHAARDSGLAVNSTHFNWVSVTDPGKEGVVPFAEILESAKNDGLTDLVIPYIHGHNRKTLDDYKRIAERCNKGAQLAKSAGIRLAYHNHNFEFQPIDGGKSGYDIFIAEFAPEMYFEVDVFWVKAGGVDPVELIGNLKGRVSQLHLKDLKNGLELPNYGGLPNDAFEELGDGMIPMEPIILAAAGAGVKHCHVEQDQSPNPIASVQQSLKHLNSL